jgi:nucleotide-binding universal stress UspA family protein
MYDPILVALDGSRRAEHVLPYVAAMAAGTGSRVILLRAIDPPRAGFNSPADSQQRLASSYLARVNAPLQNRGIASTTEVLQGTPVDIIVGRAADVRAGLIAISTRGRGGLGRLIFGSVATAVTRTATRPIFVVRPSLKGTGELHPPQRILALVGDGDTIDAGPAGHAAGLAHRYGAALTLLRTSVSVAALRAGSGPGPHPRELVARHRLDAAVAVAELARDLRERGVGAQHEALGGDAAGLALRRARQLHADLIVVGAPGPGSVAEEVARQAPCPVLIAAAHPAPVAWARGV